MPTKLNMVPSLQTDLRQNICGCRQFQFLQRPTRITFGYKEVTRDV